MREGDIERLLYILGASEIKPSREWLNISCPFASVRHQKGRDRRPSFGIRVSDGESRFFCHSCGITGDMRQLVWRLARYRGKGNWFRAAGDLVGKDGPSLAELEAKEEFSKDTEAQRSRLARSSYWASSNPEPLRRPIDQLEYDIIPEEVLLGFREMAPAAEAYLFGPRRGLTPLSVQLWELGWQPHARRVVVPVRDMNGKLVGLSGRALDYFDKVAQEWIPEQLPKFMHGSGFKRDNFLFGEHLVQKGQLGYLVEGHFDAIYLRQAGYPNAVAVMGSHLSAIQADKIVELLSEVIIVPDGDTAGGEAAAKWEARLKGRLPVHVASVYEGRDPDEYDDEELEEILSVDNHEADCYPG